MSFKYPYLLYLLFVLPFIIFYYFYTFWTGKSGLSFSSAKVLKKITRFRFHSFIRHLLFLIKLSAIAVLIIAAARPQAKKIFVEKEVEVIDIMLVLDLSRSMNALDMNGETRFKVAKEVLKEFITKITYNRVGLVAFSGEAYTLIPLTTDYSVVPFFIDSIAIGEIEDGTAIGVALANAVERLKNSKSKSKVIVLLTDGENNAGNISPVDGISMAREYGIKIYTIGFGTTGRVILRDEVIDPNTKQKSFRDVEYNSIFNTELLEQMASETGGKFYRVLTKGELVNVYEDINKLEKSKIKTLTFDGMVEYYKQLVVLALILLFIMIIVENLLFRVNP